MFFIIIPLTGIGAISSITQDFCVSLTFFSYLVQQRNKWFCLESMQGSLPKLSSPSHVTNI